MNKHVPEYSEIKSDFLLNRVEHLRLDNIILLLENPNSYPETNHLKNIEFCHNSDIKLLNKKTRFVLPENTSFINHHRIEYFKDSRIDFSQVKKLHLVQDKERHD